MEDDAESISSTSSTTGDEDPPVSCAYYKYLIVEELALQRDFKKLHVGKCSVIGKLYQNSDGDFELESLRLPQMPKEFAEPEGTFSIRLLDFDLFPNNPPLRCGRYCEASGEVVLLKLNLSRSDEKKLLTTYEFQLALRQLEEPEAQSKYIKQIQSTHTVAIKLHFSREVDRACDLVERNLSLRMFIREYQ